MKRLNRHRQYRSTRGQSIAESAAVTFALVVLGLGCLYLVLNTLTLYSHKAQLSIVANEAAKSIVGDKYFLGMDRGKLFDLAMAKQNAKDLADAMLSRLDHGKTSSFSVAGPDPIQVGDQTVYVVRVELSESVVPATPGLLSSIKP